MILALGAEGEEKRQQIGFNNESLNGQLWLPKYNNNIQELK
jgi:hypothetical protein